MNKRARTRLRHLYKRLHTLEKTFLGYPCDADFDYSPLYKFLEFPINNVGDPFEPSTYRLQTKEFEQDVLAFFAKLFHLRGHWGYITNGGTEGNLYGMYAGRETLPNAPVFFSEDAHYSIRKNAALLRLSPIIVKSQSSGEIDYGDFEKKLGRHRRAIVVANVGTTMKGAFDNVGLLSRIMARRKVENYLHTDAALYGMVLPFVSAVKFDFREPIHSIAVSGHKFLGSPIPCGVVLARKSVQRRLRSYIDYIDAHDTTISGSRDAFTPLLLWYRIRTIGLRGFSRQAKYCVALGEFLEKELSKTGWPDVDRSYLTVTFRRPSERLVRKWELATSGNLAHVICLPHENKAQLSKFIEDLKGEL